MTDARTRRDGTPATWTDVGFDAASWAAQRAAERERRRAMERGRRRVRAVVGLVSLAAMGALVAWLARGALWPPAPAYELEDVVAADVGPSAVASDVAPSDGEWASEATVTADTAPDAAAEAEPAPAHGAPDAVAAAAVGYPGAPAVQPRVISTARPAEKLVAITLDDGIPIDDRLLDLLIERRVRVTTFLLGQAVTSRRPLVERMHAAGFEIATHGWDHDSFGKMSASEMRSQLQRTQDAITDITGNQAPYFRPPYGARNETVDRIAGEMGYRVVLWDASFVDTYKNATPEYCANKALKNLHPGSIILCHWGRPATYGAMRILLDELDARGYRVVTVSELLAAPEAQMQ